MLQHMPLLPQPPRTSATQLTFASAAQQSLATLDSAFSSDTPALVFACEIRCQSETFYVRSLLAKQQQQQQQQPQQLKGQPT
ncbi:uncharacterized protein Dmoj_GI26757 [Drosophila mojavensis]|uniref:Uncharacterized protein n=1 Tax=Drosophila mojavensis TaxID=7230 RepID=A0A0Q9XFT3_DROMO|nr:uncharacterized protein Dmoj_GI26757 [Drosophila mojavensis]